MLTYDQLQCIGAVIAATGRFPHLVTAIDNELIEARLTRPPETGSMPETDTMVGQIKTAPAGNRGLTATHDLEGDAKQL